MQRTVQRENSAYEPKNLEQLPYFNITSESMVKKRMIHLLLNASKDAIEYATDIDVGKFTDVFNTEKPFRKNGMTL